MVTAPDPFDDVVVYGEELLGSALYADLVAPLQHDRFPGAES